MRIAIITPNYSLAGVPLAQYRLARVLVSRGHDVELIIGSLPFGISPPPCSGLKINILRKIRVIHLFLPLIKIFNNKKFDVIFSAEDHLNIIVLLALIFTGSRAKVSCSSRVTPFDTYSNFLFSKGWIMKQLTRLTMYRADVLTCVSQDMVLQYQEIFRSNKHICIYNIVGDKNSLEIIDEPVNHPWINDPNQKLIVAAGKLAPWKGFEDLIKAMSIVVKERHAKLLILGDGPLREDLQKLISHLKLENSIELVGYVNNTLKFFRKSDIFVLSSLVEGLPNVLVEAMICGCTPVATNCPTGPREVLQDGSYGYLVPPGDINLLAKGIIKACDKPIEDKLLNEAVIPFGEEQVLNSHSKALGIKL